MDIAGLNVRIMIQKNETQVDRYGNAPIRLVRKMTRLDRRLKMTRWISPSGILPRRRLLFPQSTEFF